MICYLDTSALVKLYIEEEGSMLVREKVSNASLVATSKVAYSEARAAFARCLREGLLDRDSYGEVVGYLNSDWPSFFIMEVTDTAIFKAGELVERYALRGFDAIHMASAVILAQRVQEDSLVIGCWDDRLFKSLVYYGFSVFPEELY